jgi:hypothetical protein
MDGAFAVIPRLSREVEDIFIKPILERQARRDGIDGREDGKREEEGQEESDGWL